MTTGEWLLSMSTLPSGTALDHFTHIEFGGTGEIVYFTVPATAVTADITQTAVTADITQTSVTADIVQATVVAEIAVPDAFTANIDQNTLEGDL